MKFRDKEAGGGFSDFIKWIAVAIYIGLALFIGSEIIGRSAGPAGATPWSVPDGDGGWKPNPECQSAKCQETGKPDRPNKPDLPDRPISEPEPPTPPNPPTIHPPSPPPVSDNGGDDEGGEDGPPGVQPPDPDWIEEEIKPWKFPPKPLVNAGGEYSAPFEQHYGVCCLQDGQRKFTVPWWRDAETAKQQCMAKVVIRSCPAWLR